MRCVDPKSSPAHAPSSPWSAPHNEAQGLPSDGAEAIMWVLEWAMGDDSNGFGDFIAGEERVIAETTAQFARHGKN